jgi:hypothetical protein
MARQLLRASGAASYRHELLLRHPLERCQKQINWYQDHSNQARVLFRVVQMSVIVLSALTPVLILLPDAPKVVQAVPPALAAIGAAATGFFQWRENWMRNAINAERLKSEKFKFEIRATVPYRATLDDEHALETSSIKLRRSLWTK